ncbi:MAG: Lipid A biosynthesis lauroyl acyltransferase (EC [uncultured Thiotrichaceae bacterium]|uniref:Lipid A biosynthesis lauroyl acyltransferase (EC) n=1 Tax=uncultured Thiotrichaceae bacterium TaxID=298394 RepID=A0A6S6U1C9_9GAMM|nr:MAG: Lipid A biosynthesis lauroyl acyltransferase (EC [uncultured Thiotrichaceae bacterium]
MSSLSRGRFLHPRYWLIWFGLGVLWVLTKLPWRFAMGFGTFLGKALFPFLGSRRLISCINLQIAFPELTDSERKKLNLQHFISLLQGIIDSALSWWGSARKVKALTTTEGLHHLEKALAGDKGVILLSAHFSSLELGGRMLSDLMPEQIFHAVYRPHQNPLLEDLVAKLRGDRYGKAIPKDNIKDMVRSLRKGIPVWYAPDQGYLGKASLDVDFFGEAAATNAGTARLAKMTGAVVIPFFSFRAPDGKGYVLRLLPPLENFPSDSIEDDTRRINEVLEEQIREFPEQYLWMHKRYKKAGYDFYGRYAENHDVSGC